MKVKTEVTFLSLFFLSKSMLEMLRVSLNAYSQMFISFCVSEISINIREMLYVFLLSHFKVHTCLLSLKFNGDLSKNIIVILSIKLPEYM